MCDSIKKSLIYDISTTLFTFKTRKITFIKMLRFFISNAKKKGFAENAQKNVLLKMRKINPLPPYPYLELKSPLTSTLHLHLHKVSIL